MKTIILLLLLNSVSFSQVKMYETYIMQIKHKNVDMQILINGKEIGEIKEGQQNININDFINEDQLARTIVVEVKNKPKHNTPCFSYVSIMKNNDVIAQDFYTRKKVSTDFKDQYYNSKFFVEKY